MAHTLNLKCKGLYPAPNQLSGVPEGALAVADDIAIDQDNLARSRRGFDAALASLPLVSDRVNRFAYWKSTLIAHYGSSTLARYDTGLGSWVPYSGTYSPVSSTIARTRFLEANQNLYLTSSVGIWKLDAASVTPRAAGVPKGLDLQLALNGSSGFFTNNPQVTFTATATNLSANLTSPSSLTGLSVGQYVSGTNIPSGTKISSITQDVLTLSTTMNSTAGSNSIIVAVATGIASGQLVSGANVPTGTTVTGVAGTTITLSANVTATQAAVAVTFTTRGSVTMSANATGTASITVTASSGAQIAYRIVWGIKDANNNSSLGAPTQFASIANTTGGTCNVDVTTTIPSGITTAHYFQIYRSSQTASESITPSEEMQQVYEGNPSGTDISNGYVTITDQTPDSLRGQTLYTSPSQDDGGIGQANEPPPIAGDFCAFRGYTLYANITGRERMKLTILAVGSPNGLQVDDILTIGGVTYTGKAAENIGSRQFKVTTTGTPAQNIVDTASSLIKVINRSSSSTVNAYVTSGPADLPGQLVFEERTLGSGTFYAIASANGVAYSPALPTSGTTVASSKDSFKNGIYVSKLGQPEAVPLENLLPLVGSAANEILRIIPLRDYVIVLKSDGVYRVVGSTLATFQVLPFDLTTNLVAPDSAVSLANQVWALTDQGVVSISDGGVQVRSRPIENIINELFGTAISEVRSLASAVSYETDRKYILALPAASGDTTNQQCYTFNVFTSAWTRWQRKFTAGFVHPSENRLYLGNAQNSDVAVERKTGTYRDFVDEAVATPTVSSYIDYSVVLSSVTGISEGDLLYQSDTKASVITSIDGVTMTVTVQDKVSWSIASATVYGAIQCAVQWVAQTAGDPGTMHQFSEGELLFKRTRFNEAEISFFTDVSQSVESVPLAGFPIGTWGTFPWGSVPWGGTDRARPLRFYVPGDKQFASQINPKFSISQAWSAWELEGLNLRYEAASEELAA